MTRHSHRHAHHQGHQIMHGTIRQAGFWLIGGHSTVTQELNKCVTCKKLRGSVIEQRMANHQRTGQKLPLPSQTLASTFTAPGQYTRGRHAEARLTLSAGVWYSLALVAERSTSSYWSPRMLVPLSAPSEDFWHYVVPFPFSGAMGYQFHWWKIGVRRHPERDGPM